MPREKNLWVVGGWFGDRFADNSKAFFLYVHRFTKKRVVWLSRNNEVIKQIRSSYSGEAFHVWSPWGIWFSLRASVHIIDQSFFDINPWTSNGALCVNLWHGIPMKKVGKYVNNNRENHKSILQHAKRLANIFAYPVAWQTGRFFLLTTSRYTTNLLGKAFQVPKDKCIEAGYPRNDVFFCSWQREEAAHEVILQIQKIKEEGYVVIGYFPTFRDNGKDLFWGTNKEEERSKIETFFVKNKIYVVMKDHYAKAGTDNKKMSNHIILDSKEDIYGILPQLDLLVTDYSSVYYDFLLADRPVVLFQYDLQYYQEEDRGFMEGYENLLVPSRAFNVNDLLREIKNSINNANYYQKERERIKQICFSYSDGKSSYRLYKSICKLIRAS